MAQDAILEPRRAPAAARQDSGLWESSLRYRSGVDGATWPVVPGDPGAAVMSILFQLEQSQWWPAEELRRRQSEQLARLLEQARGQVLFYRERFRGLAKSATLASDAAAWLEVPLLRRADIQRAGNGLLAAALPPGHGELRHLYTSGSTGKPIHAVRTEFFNLYWSAFTIRDHLWHRRRLDGKFAAIRDSTKGKAPYPEGDRGPAWGRATGGVLVTGPSVMLNLMTPVGQMMEWLQREDPDYLLTMPAILDRLARYALEHGIRLSRLKHVETISEILRPATREICRAAFGVPIVDMYTTRETGYLALQCPDHEHYHVQAEGTLLEVLDERGRPCTPGETGRVVVTPLHNFAMPLIRYEIGDYAQVGEPCPCGRGLPVLTQILGRRQNMLILPSGEERFPLLSSGNIRDLLAIAPIRQYQFVQKTKEHIELRLVVARAPTAAEEEELRHWVQHKFGHPFAVTITCHDELAPKPSGKFEDFVSEIAG